MKTLKLLMIIFWLSPALLSGCKKKSISNDKEITLQLNQGYNFTTKATGDWGYTTDLWYTDHLGTKYLEGNDHLEDLGTVDFDEVTYPYNTTWRNYWTPQVNHVYGLALRSTAGKHLALKVLEVAADSSFVKIKYRFLD